MSLHALENTATLGATAANSLDPQQPLYARNAPRTQTDSLDSQHKFALRVHPSQPAQFAHMPSARCVVCDAVLPRRFTSGVQILDSHPSCQTVACRMVVSRRAEMGEAGFRHYLQMQARHKQHLAGMAQAAAARKRAEVQENLDGWFTLRSSHPAAPALETLNLLLPSGPRRASRVTAKRRASYRAHLLKIIAEADGIAPSIAPLAQVGVSPGAAGAPGAAAVSMMPGQLCALCGGGCCTRGGDHAYLSGPTLRRFMDAQPALTRVQVLAAYLDRVGVKHQAGSCINHGAQGCSLPKEMRSDICNRFSCESLAKLQAAQREGSAVQAVLIVRRKQDHWHRAEPGLDNAVNTLAVLRESGLQRVRAGTGLRGGDSATHEQSGADTNLRSAVG